MPSIINVGVFNISTPQQNSSIFVGETVLTGMDANMKLNNGAGGLFGIFNANAFNINTNFDNLEFADGNIFDQDLKPSIGGTI